MPRVTTQEHYRRHCFLRMLWCDSGLNIFFSLLNVPAQWQLREYYCPKEDLNENEFKEYSKTVDTKYPQLSHVVGKHFKVIEEVFITASKAFGVDQAQMRHAILMAMARSNKTPKRSKLKPKNQIHLLRTSSSNVHIAAIAKPLDVEKLGEVFLKLSEYSNRKQAR